MHELPSHGVNESGTITAVSALQGSSQKQAQSGSKQIALPMQFLKAKPCTQVREQTDLVGS